MMLYIAFSSLFSGAMVCIIIEGLGVKAVSSVEGTGPERERLIQWNSLVCAETNFSLAYVISFFPEGFLNLKI